MSDLRFAMIDLGLGTCGLGLGIWDLEFCLTDEGLCS